jgi:hypothetical protein
MGQPPFLALGIGSLQIVLDTIFWDGRSFPADVPLPAFAAGFQGGAFRDSGDRTEMAVRPPDIPQDWQSRWSTMRTRKRTISFCTDRRYGFEAKFPLLLRPQLGEIANPRLW